MNELVLEADINVDPDQQRGYIGLTVLLCTIQHLTGPAHVSNIFHYIMSSADEYFLVTVTAN